MANTELGSKVQMFKKLNSYELKIFILGCKVGKIFSS